MTRILLVISLLLPLILQAQHHLPGLLTYQNSGDSAVVGAEITALWSNGAVSDADGRFQLVFSGKGPGYQTQLTVVMPGHEVVNKKDLLHTLKADLHRPLKLYLCKEGEWERNAVAYYKINEEQITRRYREELAAVRQDLQDNQQQLADSLQQLEELYRFALQQAQRLAEQFAQANLDDADSLYIAAFEQFKLGNIDSAINILADDLLDANMAEAQLAKADADSLRRAGESKLANAIEARRMLARSFWLRYRSKKLLQAEAAAEDLARAFQLAPGNPDICLAYARHHLSRQPQLALKQYRGLLARPSPDVNPQQLWWEMGQAYQTLERRDSAITAWENSLAMGPPHPPGLTAALLEAYLDLAHQRLLRAQGLAAEQILQQALTLSPDNLAVSSYLGLAWVLQDEWKRAKSHYQALFARADYSHAVQEECLAHLKDLQRQGVAHPRFKRLEKMMLQRK